MRWKFRDEYEWRLVFAWLPHCTDDGWCVWLETVDKRARKSKYPFPPPLFFPYEYRLIGGA